MDKIRFCMELIRTSVPNAILTLQILIYYQ
jgi:hypothetical protein